MTSISSFAFGKYWRNKPYSSWERGQNENANGLLRQYFPKAMELIDVTIKDVLGRLISLIIDLKNV